MRRRFGFLQAWLGPVGWAGTALCLASACVWAAERAAAHSPWRTGPYSVSDELGGFTITGATGAGTREDPLVVTQDLASASPVTVVIRATGPLRPFDAASSSWVTGFLHLTLVVRNGSGLPWVEFGLELQEALNEPSVFGDGLSFDQRGSETGAIRSDRFRSFDRDFEPFDRLLFMEGKVDPRDSAEFSVLITDFTPQPVFYLVLDPRVPFS